MTIEKYRNEYPFLKCLDIMTKVRKVKNLDIWRIPYVRWEVKHFNDVVRIKNDLEPLLKTQYGGCRFASTYNYFINGQLAELNEISEEIGMQPQSIINELIKNENNITRLGLTITREKK